MSGPLPSTARDPVFISFASENLELATRIRTTLETAGIRCWMAPRDIEPGVSFPAAISAAITSCGALLLLLTESSNTSPHVLSEVELAFNARKPILPVRLSTLTPSPNLRYFISTTQWFDAEADFNDDDAARLRTRLEKLLAGEAVGAEKRRSRQNARRVAIAAAALTLVAGLVSVFLYQRAPSNRNEPGALVPGGQPASTGPPAVQGAPAAANGKPSNGVRKRVNALDGQTYMWVPPGEFTMGCSAGDPACEDDEMPAHVVSIREGFWLAQSEVTAAQYAKAAVASSTPQDMTDGSLPAVGVTWEQAKAYCAAVGGRLPTEAEWEYAARAGTAGRYHDTLASVAWYTENSDEGPHPVASKQPNAFGLHDMLGNVYEWVLDRYYNAYDDTSEAKTIEEPLAPNASAVARGGSWASQDRDLRVSNRFGIPPDAEEAIIGFRCAQAER